MNMFKTRLFVLATLICILFVPEAKAVLDLHVQETLPVYASRNKGGAEVSTLVKGDVVVISPKTYGAYRKVLVTYDGKRRAGYVLADKIVRSFIRDRDEEERLSADVIDYKRAKGLGLSLVGSYMRQGARSITSADGSLTYDISSMTSFTTFFSIFYDYPLANLWVVRPYLTFRQTKFKGSATLNGLSSTTTPSATISQNFLGFGALAKRYASSTSSFWYGGAMEIAKGSGVSVKLTDGVSIDTKDEKLPLFVILQGAVGFDVALGQSGLFLLPDVRIGAVPNTSPFILSFESFISLAYAF